MACRRKIR